MEDLLFSNSEMKGRKHTASVSSTENCSFPNSPGLVSFFSLLFFFILRFALANTNIRAYSVYYHLELERQCVSVFSRCKCHNSRRLLFSIGLLTESSLSPYETNFLPIQFCQFDPFHSSSI